MEVKPNDLTYQDTNYNVLGMHIPSSLDFCGEKIPSNDMGIKMSIEKEFDSGGNWKINSHILFNKANRWFPIIEPILKNEGIPEDFKYLAVIESHLSNVTSPVGAAGFWQLVPSSAYNYGLEVNEQIDERYNVEKSTVAACKHIKEAYSVFKSWTLAAAAYNLGIGGITNAMKKQRVKNYYDLLLNSETGSFVYRILTYKTLLSNPKHFGINRKNKKQNVLHLKTFKVDSNVRQLKYVALKLGVSEELIKQFNPWILKNEINNAAKKTYELKVPKNLKIDYSGYLNDLNAQKIQNHDGVEEKLVPSDTSSLAVIKPILYVVKINEPLKNVASFFEVKLEDLCKWNNLKENDVAIKGQTLTIFR